ncbi:MAG: BatD family protein [Chitinophagaceae bacterium]
MKKGILTISILLLVLVASAQVVLKTLVTEGPVIAGEPFVVQYVLENAEPEEDFFQPDFRQFRFVSGPNTYTGASFGTDGPKRLKNITFTLVALKEGHYIVPGASVKLHGQVFKSEPAPLEVISRAAAVQKGILSEKPSLATDSYLQPGEDPYEKIRHNLFMKVMVDKKVCVVGQPVTATFKLYSRLSSKSDIVKNPGFYGFAIQDMVSLSDNVSATETVDGKKFQVHTVRKVQLYPLQAGLFTIDPMEVQSRVEFSTSMVSKKSEQEIVEGVMPTEDELFSKPGFKVCETSMHTEPVAIKVNPLPEHGRPAEFNGATGKFTIAASLEKQELARNEEGDLVVTIEGKGNFPQLAAPLVSWPKAMEGFEPEVKDSLNKELSPLEGRRVFTFRFISNQAGTYTIPAINLSFFDPDSNRYRTTSTKPITVKITEAAAKKLQAGAEKGPVLKKNIPVWIITGVAVLAAALFIVIRRKDRKPIPEEPVKIIPVNKPKVTELLQPAYVLQEAEGHSFYAALRTAIWQFCSQKFNLSGSSMSKRSLQEALQQANITQADQQELLRILDVCEEGLFTGAMETGNRKELLEDARRLLLKIGDAALPE